MKKLLSFLGGALLLLDAQAQQVKPLTIGDTVPDITIHNVINYKDSSIRLYNIQDKSLLIDTYKEVVSFVT